MKTSIRFLILLLAALSTLSLCKKNVVSMGKQEKQSSFNSDSTQIISGLIVQKPFVNKAGKASDFKEMYFRLSVQDYFIKFCESKITKADLQAHLDSLPESGLLGDKAVSLEIEIKNGEWDNCEEEYPVQSRVGDYVVVYRIVE